MKRLSELPERDRTDETQQLIGDNPVKLLAATPTEDVLVKPEDLMAKITGIEGSSDMWANLEQIKEAYEKGPEAPETLFYTNGEAGSWLKEHCPHYQNNNNLFIYLPNTNLTYPLGGSSVFGAYVLANNFITINGVLATATGDTRIYVPRKDNTKLTFTYTASAPGPLRLGTGGYTGATCILNFPNMERCTTYFSNMDGNMNSYSNCNITCLFPKLTSSSNSSSVEFLNIRRLHKSLRVKYYLPAINAPLKFFTFQPVAFEDIKYLLDNINKAPTTSNKVQQTYFTFMGAIPANTGTITWTLSDDSTGSASISEVTTTGTAEKQKIVDAINADTTLSQYVEAYLPSGSTNTINVRAKSGKNIKALKVETTNPAIIQPASNPSGSVEVQAPLVIDCGVDESLGTYADPDAKTGWTPTGDLATTVTNFFTACENKWTINWHPVLA